METITEFFIPLSLENIPIYSSNPSHCSPDLFSVLAFLASPTRHTDGDGCCQAARAGQDPVLAVSYSLGP